MMHSGTVWKRLLSYSSSVGFIGLGQMGGPMARNLVKKGVNLKTFDSSSEARNLFENCTESLEDLAKNSNFVITMLPNSTIVREVYEGNGGVFAHAKKGTVMIDCSTIEHDVARDLASKAKSGGFSMIDAPVSGGILGAGQGTLTIMVGGSKIDLEKSTSLLKLLGERILHCGPSGSGQIAKACNNMLLGISMAGLCESLVLGEKLGIDPRTLLNVINSSSGRCWSSEIYAPVPGIKENSPASHNYQPGFTNMLMHKDLKLALKASEAFDPKLTMGKAAMEVYERLANDVDIQKKDFSILYSVLKRKQSTKK